MKYAFAQVAFGLGANALVARDAPQCVQLKASGGASGTLGQYTDGQNRIGGDYPTGCYCFTNGGFTDSKGRGCILTPPTTQFQCDMGASPTTGFAIGSDGGVTYNGSGKFYACPYNDQGGYNIYSQPAPNQSKCVEISLSSAGSCGQSAQSSPAPKPSPKPTPSPQPSKPMSSPPAQNTCPAPVTVTMTAQAPPASTVTKSAEAPPAVTVTKTAEAPPAATVTKTAAAPPAVTVTAPCDNKPASTVTVTAPCANTPAPSPQPQYTPMPSKPAAQPSKPAAQPSKPAAQPSKPAAQPSMPAAQPSMPAAQPSKPAQQPSGSCPADINGNYQYPHLIVPVDSSSPDKSYGTSYNGKVDKSTCSIFNFDIPASYSGKQCSVIFLFPQQKDLETSSYTTSGSGSCSFSQLSSPATQSTSWSNAPSKKSDLGSMSIAPGNSYTIASGDCAAGQTVSYEMCSSGDFSLDYFQDYNPSPIGMYVRSC